MSAAIISVVDSVPDEEDAAISLPQQYYISSFTGWMDPKREPAIRDFYRDRYKRMLSVSGGCYVADYDVTCDDANVSRSSRSSRLGPMDAFGFAAAWLTLCLYLCPLL